MHFLSFVLSLENALRLIIRQKGIIMKNIICLVLSIVLLSGCQTLAKTDYEEGYVTPAGYSGDNPYWSNNYRLNTSNYFGNREFYQPGPELYN